MPGLIRGVARTAVIAGTATTVSNRVSRRQANRWASQEEAAPAYLQAPQAAPAAAPAPAPAPAPQESATQTPDLVAQLNGLADLRDRGVLSAAEFEAQKAKLLAA